MAFALVGAFLGLLTGLGAMWKLRTRSTRKEWVIQLFDAINGNMITLEVKPTHTISSIVKTVIDSQNLSKKDEYCLRMGDRMIQSDDPALTIEQSVIRPGDRIDLVKVRNREKIN